MELNYLREFVALAQTCQFQKTADDLYISQSSLSKHIRAIEKELGRALLTRTSRRVELTDFGKEFLPYATQIALIQKEYTETLHLGGSEKKFTIGIAPIITLYTLFDYISQFAEKFPKYRIEVIEATEEELLKKLRRAECDIVIVSRQERFDDNDLCSTLYTKDQLMVIMSNRNPLVNQESVSIEDVSPYPFIQKGSYNFGKLLDSSLLPSMYTAERSAILMKLISMKNGVCILPKYAATQYIKESGDLDIVIKKLAPATDIYMDMVYPKARANSMFIKSVIEFLNHKNKTKVDTE